MKTILVTGAPGWIGSFVTRELVGAGHRVLALARPGEPLDRIADVLPDVELVEADLAAPALLEARLRDSPPQVCLHLAWYAAPGRYLTAPENLDCVAASLNLLRLLDTAGCERTVITGTCFEYDTDTTQPLSEQSAIRPRSLYAACKHALHVVADQFQRDRGRQLAWARIFYLYGPWEAESRLVPHVVRNLLARRPCPLTAGRQVRDYLHVADVAGALCAVALSSVQGAVNIGAGQPVTVADVARAIGRILAASEWLRLGEQPTAPGDPSFVCADPRRLRDELGWSPKLDLESGLENTCEWWKHR